MYKRCLDGFYKVAVDDYYSLLKDEWILCKASIKITPLMDQKPINNQWPHLTWLSKYVHKCSIDY